MPPPRLQLILGIFAGEQINKLGRTRFFCAAGFAVGGNDGLAQSLKGFVLLGWEKFRSVNSGRRRGLFRGHHVVRVFCCLRRNYSQD